MPAVVAPIFACPEHPVLDTVSVSGSRELFQDISAVLDIPPSRKRTVDSPVTVGGRRRKLPRRRSKSGGGVCKTGVYLTLNLILYIRNFLLR